MSGDLTRHTPRLGFGSRPAVLVVDFARGWTDRSSPMAGDFDAQVEACATLVALGRRFGVPIIYTTVAYELHELESVLMLRKTPRVRALVSGSRLTEIDPRIAPSPGELVLVKKHASAFFGTDLHDHLRADGVDTLLLAGCITSGCIRTTAADAAQYGIRPIVVAEAVGDRSAEAHHAALVAIDSLYGDVVSLADVEAQLAGA